MAETKMQLVDWLDDLCVRFIINLPQEELESVERICFQVEEAQWFYEDFIRPLDPSMPSLNLRQFCLLMFQHCPLLAPFPEHQHLAAFDEFLAYKVRVPVRGAIMLNQDMDEVVLVRGWKKNANWSFPRGKINKDEDDLDCAIREVYEETGFDIAAAGLVPERSKQKFLEVTMREQHMKLFVFRGVPQDTMFQPRTRKEISKIQWYKLANLPGYHKNKQKSQSGGDDTVSANKLYMVAPFMQPLKKWIALQHKLESALGRGIVQEMSTAEDALIEGPLIGDIEQQSTPQPDKSESAEYTPHDLLTHRQSELAGKAGQMQPFEVDSAVDQKRLLSVKQLNSAQVATVRNPPVNANASNLLALLRRAPAAAPEALACQPNPPKTPSDQILLGLLEPDSPRYDHTRHQLLSGMPPPPSFPLSPAQLGTYQNHPFQYPSSSVNKDGSPHIVNNNVHPPLFQHSMQAAAPQAHDSKLATPESMVALSSQQVQAPRPYQRTGDPQFARPLQAADRYGSTIPSASQLPAPTLSSHAQSLLDVFKSSKPPIPSTSVSSQAPILSATTTTSDQPSTSIRVPFDFNERPVKATEASQAESRSRQFLSQLATTAPNQSSGFGLKSLATDPQGVRSNTHQDALLKLFRSPSVTIQVPEQTTTESRGLAPPPVDLSAIPSPSLVPQEVSTGNGQNIATIETDVPTPSLELQKEQIPARHRRVNESTSLASATVSGPANVPEFGSVKRKTRAAHSSLTPATNVFLTPNEVDTGTVRRHARAPKSAHERAEKHSPQHRPNPIQILKRPVSDTKVDITPSTSPEKPPQALAELKSLTPKPSTPKRLTASKPSSPTPPAPKPFQPQILRRPQPASPAPPVGQPTLLSRPQTLDRQAAAAAAAPSPDAAPVASPPTIVDRPNGTPTAKDQKDVLLSLFGKAKVLGATASQASLEDQRSAVVSPVGVVSPPNIVATGPSKSVLNSVPEFEVPAPVMDFSRSRMNSMASVMSRDRAGSGSQTPISPSDRGFLLNYLRGL